MSKVTEAQPKPFSSKLPKKLVRLLRDVQGFIVENPKQFNMEIWAEPGKNACDTVGCICGHMALRDTPKRTVARLVKETREQDDGGVAFSSVLLDHIDTWRDENIPGEFVQNFYQLFYLDEGWDDFRTKELGNITPRLAAKRIDHFLETGK
jgi:hypothetical protein